MGKTKVSVTIMNTRYALLTDEQPSYVEQLGTVVDEKIGAIMTGNKRMDLMTATVLSALDLADEAAKAKSDTDNLRQQMTAYLEENAKLRAENDKLRRDAGRKNG